MYIYLYQDPGLPRQCSLFCAFFTSCFYNNIYPSMFNPFTQILLSLPLFLFPIVDGTLASVPKLPIVDLGYELHQASSYNVSERESEREAAFLQLQSPPYIILSLPNYICM